LNAYPGEREDTESPISACIWHLLTAPALQEAVGKLSTDLAQALIGKTRPGGYVPYSQVRFSALSDSAPWPYVELGLIAPDLAVPEE